MNKFFSLRVRLFAVFTVIAVLAGGMIFYQSSINSETQTQLVALATRDTPRLLALESLKASVLDQQRQLLTYLQTKQSKQDFKTTLDKLQKAQDQHYKEYQAHPSLSTVYTSQLAALQAQSSKLLQKTRELSELQKNTPAIDAPVADTTQQTDILVKNIDALIDQENQSLNQQTAILQSRHVTANTALFIAGIGLIAITLGMGVLSIRFIDHALSRLKKGAARLANGDFSQSIQVESRDELGAVASAFNQMADRLRDSYNRLALEKQRDEALLESMGEGVLAVDDKANIVMANRVATTLLELPERTAILGTSLFKTYQLYSSSGDQPVHDQDQPAAITLNTGLAATDTFSFHRSSDKKVLLSISTYPITLNEKIVGAIMIIRDVTKEKEIDRMKTEFISLASHQLRTPLSAIKWFIEMLIAGDAGKLQPEQLDFAKNISDSTQRMIELVNSLLNISRIESGRIIIDPKPTDLRELVTGIVNDLKAKTEERKQTLIVSVHKDLPKINLDPRLIGQVYLNFLTNAVKYTPKGGEISVFISRKDNEVVSQISDNGYGIPKEEQTKMFKKFFRATNVAKFETDGTGLGLYLVKAIIESSGGKVWFKSEEGKGTTFWFSLPMSGMKAKEGEVTLDI